MSLQPTSNGITFFPYLLADNAKQTLCPSIYYYKCCTNMFVSPDLTNKSIYCPINLKDLKYMLHFGFLYSRVHSECVCVRACVPMQLYRGQRGHQASCAITLYPGSLIELDLGWQQQDLAILDLSRYWGCRHACCHTHLLTDAEILTQVLMLAYQALLPTESFLPWERVLPFEIFKIFKSPPFFWRPSLHSLWTYLIA